MTAVTAEVFATSAWHCKLARPMEFSRSGNLIKSWWLENDGWKTILSFWGWPIFRGELLLNFQGVVLGIPCALDYLLVDRKTRHDEAPSIG